MLTGDVAGGGVLLETLKWESLGEEEKKIKKKLIKI